jgi:hypothetical protein
MFIGHFALGFAAKRAAPRLSLATLFAAAQLADVIWPFLVAAGVEQVRIQPGITAFTPLDFVSYPYSHSLLALVVWGVLFGAIAVEVAMFAVGVWMQATRERDAIGRRAFAAFVGFIVVAYFGSMGPPPPNIAALVVTAIAGAAVIFVWAWWFDRHRVPDA